MEAEKSEICIRRMEKADLPAVCDIEKTTFSDPWTMEGFARALQTPGNVYLVALQGRQVAGYCGLYRSFEEGEIVNVAVHPSCREKGIGFTLVSELLEEGRAEGISRFVLEVRISNAGAIRLYEKLGFKCLGIRRDFYALPREDALIMAYAQDEG